LLLTCSVGAVTDSIPQREIASFTLLLMVTKFQLWVCLYMRRIPREIYSCFSILPVEHTTVWARA